MEVSAEPNDIVLTNTGTLFAVEQLHNSECEERSESPRDKKDVNYISKKPVSAHVSLIYPILALSDTGGNYSVRL